ncbi:MAG: hypothetical protein FJ379_10800 [Verrucomicrobia bacterium]|nr:hypothetical protein [Verrucomicrobiota bacterium]
MTFETINMKRLMMFLRNALGRGEDGWSDLVHLLPGCLVGTELVVRGQRPAEDLEDLGVAVRAVLEGIYTRRGNPASKLDAVSPHQLAGQLESLVRQLRDMRSPEEVSLDLKEAHGERAQLLEALRADCDAASRSQDPGGTTTPGLDGCSSGWVCWRTGSTRCIRNWSAAAGGRRWCWGPSSTSTTPSASENSGGSFQTWI